MNSPTLPVVARIVAKPGKEDALKAILLEVVVTTRGETGCRRYELLQSSGEPTEFLTLEEWADEAAIDAHLASAHVQRALTQAQELLAAAPDIRRYARVEGR